MRRVSTRQYRPGLPEMADSVGISRSAVSRERIEAAEAEQKKLLERPLKELDLWIIYMDGICFAEHHLIAAVGVELKKLSEWLEADYPAASSSLLEGLEECFTLHRLGLPASLHRCLATTNLIESPQSGVRRRTRRVTRWRDADLVLRWVASAFLATESNFRKISGYQDLWMLKAILHGSKPATRQAVA